MLTAEEKKLLAEGVMDAETKAYIDKRIEEATTELTNEIASDLARVMALLQHRICQRILAAVQHGACPFCLERVDDNLKSTSVLSGVARQLAGEALKHYVQKRRGELAERHVDPDTGHLITCDRLNEPPTEPT